MDFLEKDLEDIIYEAAQTKEGRNFLLNKGLPIQSTGKMYRQVHLGDYGVADLIDISIESIVRETNKMRFLYIEVIELKKGIIDLKALGQSCRYLTGVKDMANSILNYNAFNECYFHISLIGSEIDYSDNGSFLFLYNEIENFADIFTYNYKIDGIHFEHIQHTWHKITPNFNQEAVKSIQHPTYSELKQCIRFYDLRNSSLL